MRARSGWLASSALLLLTACPQAVEVEPRPSTTASPSPSGALVAAVPEEPATLNPLTLAGLAPATRDLLPLLTPAIGPSGTVRAEVAVSGVQVRVTPVPGSRWSDGTAVTAADIVRTFGLVRAARVPFGPYAGIASARADGAAAVLDHADAAAATASASRAFRVLPPGFTAAAYRKAWPVSGGPFVIERWTPGLRIRFAANPAAPGGPPGVARLDVNFLPDPEAALELFERGEIDILPRYGAPSWHRRASEAGAVSSTGSEFRTFGLAVRSTLGGASARRRLLARIDLARINSVLVQDEATVACDRAPSDPVCSSNPPGATPGAAGRRLRLGFEASDRLAAGIAHALQRMLGDVALQARTGSSLWTHLDQSDLVLIGVREEQPGAPVVLRAVSGAPDATAADARVLVMFRARADLGSRGGHFAPGPDGPFDGAGDWRGR